MFKLQYDMQQIGDFVLPWFFGQAGDHSHIPADEESVKKLVQEELRKESFTAVVITGIKQEHIAYMKAHFKHWCRQLAYDRF